MAEFGDPLERPANSLAVIKYTGAKWNLSDWIIGNMPRHDIYLEPFFGSGAVFFSKPPVRTEVINDLDGQVVNLFRVCRDRPKELVRALELTPVAIDEHRAAYDEPEVGEPIEDARRMVVRAWMSFGGRQGVRGGFRRNFQQTRSTIDDWMLLPERVMAVTSRLRGAVIENEDAVALIGRYKNPETLIYADPPYPFSVRSDTVHDKYYRTEMGKDADHLALLDALDAHPGLVILSGYACPLYDDRLVGWKRIDRTARAQLGEPKIESLWLNRRASARVGHQMTIFDILPEG